jgi:hypothetical protein
MHLDRRVRLLGKLAALQCRHADEVIQLAEYAENHAATIDVVRRRLRVIPGPDYFWSSPRTASARRDTPSHAGRWRVKKSAKIKNYVYRG